MPISVFAASDNQGKAVYDGGSIPESKAGTVLTLYVDAAEILLMNDKTLAHTVPVACVPAVPGSV